MKNYTLLISITLASAILACSPSIKKKDTKQERVLHKTEPKWQSLDHIENKHVDLWRAIDEVETSLKNHNLEAASLLCDNQSYTQQMRWMSNAQYLYETLGIKSTAEYENYQLHTQTVIENLNTLTFELYLVH